MIYIIYFIIVFLATAIGSLSGMGGGVIIKPSLDYLSFSKLASINYYSSLAVLTMSFISLLKKKNQKNFIDKISLVYIAMGSILGGILGQKLFNTIILFFNSDNIVKLIQISITIIILSISIYYTTNISYTINLKNKFFIFIASLLLGIISTFLGIGGGPINVSLFIFLFGFDIKTSTLFSIASIFFSQLSKNIFEIINLNFKNHNLIPLVFIIPAAILGGFIGTKLNIFSSNKFIKKVYNITTLSVILLNIFNAFRILLK